MNRSLLIWRLLVFLLLLALSQSSGLKAQDLFEEPFEEDEFQPSTLQDETSPQPELETRAEAPPEKDSRSPAPEPFVSTPKVKTSPDVHDAQLTAQTEPDGQRQNGQKSANVDTSAKSPEEQWGQHRILGGHRFPIGAFVPMALSVSYLGVRAGFEYHEVPGFAVSLIPESQPRTVSLQTVNVREDIDFALRVHEYITLFGDAYGRGRVGVNIESLLGSGAEYTYGGNLGALVRIFRVGSFQIALRGRVGYYSGQKAGIQMLYSDLGTIAIDALERLWSMLNSPDLNKDAIIAQMNASFATATAELVAPFDGFIYGASLNLALALGKYVGLQGALGFSYNTETLNPTTFDTGSGTSIKLTSASTMLRPSLSTALDFDAIALGIPIDIFAEYRLTPLAFSQDLRQRTISEFTFEHLVALSFFYSGRADLQVGITGYTLLEQVPVLNANTNEPSSGKPQDFGIQPVLRYFW